MVPTGKVSPLLFVDVKLVTPQLSDAEGAIQVTAAPHCSASLLTVMLAGISAMAGAWLSVMITSNEALTVLPAASVAVYVTVVVPTAKVSPLLCVEVNVDTPQLSLAVGAV